MKKKVIAIVLAVSVLLSAFVIPASANTVVTNPAERGFYRTVDKIIDTLVGGIAALIKSPKWDAKKDYVSENFYSGTDEFLDAPQTAHTGASATQTLPCSPARSLRATIM